MDQREVKLAEGNSEPGQISHLALDIGGSLIKVVYFSRSNGNSCDSKENRYPNESVKFSYSKFNPLVVQGSLNFAMFETSKIDECLKFLMSKKPCIDGSQHHRTEDGKNFIKATGGGAYKFAELFKENLGIVLDKEDEMDCLVAGANFLLKAVHQEAFTYMEGREEYVQIDHDDLFPFLLVNIGSGVSMIKVDGEGKYERISGTSAGGGTFWGLGRLLTKCKSFDELLELSHRGNNRVIDMLVGDIYGGADYSKIGLASTNIASSFGKAISDNKELEDYEPEDVARSLLRMISNNIGQGEKTISANLMSLDRPLVLSLKLKMVQIAYLNALRFGLKKIFFGGYFIRGHSYTMDTISVAVSYWSKGEAKAMFLRHEGFLGALGAFKSYEKNSL